MWRDGPALSPDQVTFGLRAQPDPACAVHNNGHRRVGDGHDQDDRFREAA